MTISLPTGKYNQLMAQLRTWGRRNKCKKRELLSLIGTLSSAAKVVKPGRMFLRRLINLSTTVSKLDHSVTLNAEDRADIEWWTESPPPPSEWGRSDTTPAGDVTRATILHRRIRQRLWSGVW